MIEGLLAGAHGNVAGSLGPGPTALIAGNSTAGYFGTIQPADFISGSALATAIGLTVGSVLFDTLPWFKVILKGKVLFIPQKSIRSGVSWQDIYLRGAVYGDGTTGRSPIGATKVTQNATVMIQGYHFKVRLLRGANVDPPTQTGVYDPSQSVGSEWNSILYNLCATDPATQVGPNWATYTQSELGTVQGINQGEWTLCMERYATTTFVLARGGYGLTSFWQVDGTSKTAYYGWRPVLELVG